MKGLGVEISLAKSLVSYKGTALEFAKRTIYKGFNVSPLSLRELFESLSTGPAFVALIRKYGIAYSNIRQLIGLGYRSSSSRREKLLRLLMSVPSDRASLEKSLKFFYERANVRRSG
jgi:hypothetical protein